jgi:hypothetical protein
LYDFFVFKTAGNVAIVNDYLLKLRKQQHFNKEKTNSLTDNLLIGRIPHICHTEEDQITDDSISERERNSDKTSTAKQKMTKSHLEQKSPICVDE